VGLDWIWDTAERQVPGDRTWNDHATGARGLRLAIITDDALRDGETPDADLLALLAACRQHLVELSDPAKLALQYNHGLHQLQGLMNLCGAVPELLDAGKLRTRAAAQLRQACREHFAADAIHREHSPSYHVSVTKMLGQYLERGWISNDPEMVQLYRD